MSELEGVFKVGMYCPFCRSPKLTITNSHEPIRLVQCGSCKVLFRLILYTRRKKKQ